MSLTTKQIKLWQAQKLKCDKCQSNNLALTWLGDIVCLDCKKKKETKPNDKEE
jgi:RNA polymerase subunit RPABC4/transcription elongation factor Spt4